MKRDTGGARRKTLVVGGALLAVAGGLMVGLREGPTEPSRAVAVTAPPPAAIAAPPAKMSPAWPWGLSWQIGQSRTYRVDQFNQTRINMAMDELPTAGADDEPERFSESGNVTAKLAGTLTIVIIAESAGNAVAQATFKASELKLSGGQGSADEKSVEEARARLELPFFVTLSPKGRVIGVRAPEALMREQTAMSWLQAAVASLSFTYPDAPAAGWEATERDATGEYTAAYQRRDAAVIERSKVSYQWVATAEGRKAVGAAMAVKPIGKSTLAIDANGWIKSVDQDETVHMTVGQGGGPGMSLRVDIISQNRSTLRLIEESKVALAGKDTKSWEKLPSRLMGEVSTVREAAEQHAAAKAKALHLPELLTQLRALKPEEDQREATRLVNDLATKFRGDEQAAREAASIALQEQPAAAHVVLAGLGVAGAPEAQASLLKVAENMAAPRDRRLGAVSQLGMVRVPREDLVPRLAALFGDGDGDVRANALIAIGGVAGGQRKDHPAAADAAVDRILAHAERTPADGMSATAALGNAGDPRTLAFLDKGLQADDPVLRATAVMSLRKIRGEQVDLRIEKSLEDPAWMVRAAAINASSHRDPARYLDALASRLKREEMDEVRDSIASLLALGPSRVLPGTRGVLEWVAQNDSKEDLRKKALWYLAGMDRDAQRNRRGGKQ